MKYILIILFVIIRITSSTGQLSDNMILNIGKGVLNTEFDEAFKEVEKPLMIAIDKRLFSSLYLGVELNHKKITLANNSNYINKILGIDWILGLRGKLLFRKKQALRFYTGGFIGYHFLFLREELFWVEEFELQKLRNMNHLVLLSAIHLGIQYYPKNRFGYYIEFSSSKSLVKLEFAFKL